MNSSRTTGAACMSASSWGTRRFCSDGNGTGGDATRRVYRLVWRPGRLNPLGFEGIANFRDVAGIDPTQPGMKVAGGRLKRGMVFRTAAWTAASQSDAEKIVNTWGCGRTLTCGRALARRPTGKSLRSVPASFLRRIPSVYTLTCLGIRVDGISPKRS